LRRTVAMKNRISLDHGVIPWTVQCCHDWRRSKCPQRPTDRL